jgi:hypothetical protein
MSLAVLNSDAGLQPFPTNIAELTIEDQRTLFINSRIEPGILAIPQE